ncbi:MAG TPA: LptA/OstA family protein, partial [Bacillota bacterium]|nr:LptA/OstA family protein [Bacillota bacterium]
MRILALGLACALAVVSSPFVWSATKNPIKQFSNITIETSGNQTYDLEKNVVTVPDHAVITLDDVIIEADSLIYYGNQNLAVATGNVHLTKKGIKLTAAKLTYRDNTGLVEATGNARLVALKETYTSETIRYNLKNATGEVGKFQGVVNNGGKDYYLTGETAFIDEAGTAITPAGLTRCPRPEHPDYIFNSKKMYIKGNDITLERVVVRVLSVPVLYLPKLTLKQGEEAPRFNMNSNQGDEPDLSSPDSPLKSSSESNGPSKEGSVKENVAQDSSKPANQATDTQPKQVQDVRSSWVYRIEANTTRPAKLALGRGYQWGRYSNRFEVELNSEGFFSLVDEYGIGWKKYHFAIDAKTDLVSDPERELGVTFTRKTWDTGLGKLKMSLFSRFLYTETEGQNYQGVYGGLRFDYQPHDLVSFS